MKREGDWIVVLNPEHPIHGSGSLGHREVWRTALDDTLRGREPWDPRPRIRVHGERIYVTDPLGAKLASLHANDGRHFEVVVGPGEGPGRLEAPRDLAVTTEALVVAEETGLELFRHDGSFLRRVPVDESVLGVYALGGRSFLSSEFTGAGVRWVRRDSAGADGERHVFAPPGSWERRDAFAQDCWSLDGSPAGLYLLDCYHPFYVRYGLAGEADREVLLADRPPEESSQAERDSLRHIARRQQKARNLQLQEDVARRFVEAEVRRNRNTPKYRQIRHDTVSGLVAVLEETPDFMGGGEATLHLSTERGAYLTSAEFSRHWLGFDLRGTRVYAVARRRGEEGLVAVAHELSLPEGMRRGEHVPEPPPDSTRETP